MMSFSLSGGVEVVGFISPTDPLDTYPVIDPLYGIDGLRNVNTLTDLNNIPDLRRRAGMLVGVNNGSQFYKLNASPWNGTITDWTLVNFGGADTYVTGTTFNSNQAILTRNDSVEVFKLSGGTNVLLSNPSTNEIVINVSADVDTNTFVTGFTYDNSNNLTINRNDGVDFSVNVDTMSGLTINGDLLVTGTTNISGLTSINSSLDVYNGTIGLRTNDYFLQGTSTGGTNVQLIGVYSNDEILIGNQGYTNRIMDDTIINGQLSVLSGLTVNGPLSACTGIYTSNIYGCSPITINDIAIFQQGLDVITGDTILQQTSATTITLTNLPNLNNTATEILARNSSTGLVEYRDVNTITPDTNIFVTGFTYDNVNTFTISRSDGVILPATISVLSGITYYGDGSNLSGVTSDNFYVTGGTYNSSTDTLTLLRNDGNFVNITGITDTFTIGATYDNGTATATFTRNDGNTYTLDLSTIDVNDTFVTGFTYNNANTFTISRNDGVDLNSSFNTVTGLTVNGTLDATTILSGGTNLTTIIESLDTNTFVSGGTYNTGTQEINFVGNSPETTFDVDLSSIISTDTYVTGFTFNPSTYDLTIRQNEGQPNLVSNLAVLATDVYVVSGVYNPSTGIVTYTNSSGGTFQVSGFTTGMTDSYTTDAYLSGTEIRFDNNIQGVNFYNVDLLPVLSGKTDLTLFNSHTADTNNPHQTSFNNLTSTAHTHTISDVINLQTELDSKLDTTTFNTYTANTQTILDGKIDSANNVGGANEFFKDKSGTTLNFRTLSGGTNTTVSTVGDIIKVDTVDLFTTGATYDNGTALATFTKNDGTTYTLDLSSIDVNDTFITGFTYNNANTFTLNRNDGVELNTTINNVSGLTVNGTLSALTIDGGTILSGGTNLSSVIESLDTYVTGGTVSISGTDNSNNGTIGLFYKNSDGTPRTLPFEDTFTTGGTYDNGTALITFDKNDGTSYNVDLSTIDVNDTFVTGFTYNDANTFTISNNDGTSFNSSINIMTGFTVNNGVGDGFVTINSTSGQELEINQRGNNFNYSTPNIQVGTTGANMMIGSTGGIGSYPSGSYPGLNLNTTTGDIFLFNGGYGGTGAVMDFGGGNIRDIRDIQSSGNWPLKLYGGPGPNDANDGIQMYTADNLNVYTKKFEIKADTGTPDAYFTNINNFGVNTTTPQYTLDVNGTTRLLGLTANTLNLVTTPTLNNSATDILVRNSSTGEVEYRPVSGITPDTNTFVSGGTYNDTTNNINFSGNSAETTFDVDLTSLVSSVSANTFVIAGGYSNSTDTISLLRNDGVFVNITGVTDTFTTGGTYDNGTALITFDKNDGTTYDVDLSSLDLNDTYVTGGTLTQPTDNTNSGLINLLYSQDVSPSTYSIPYTDTFITGFTYDDNNTFTIVENNGDTHNVTFNEVSGLTVNGTLDVTGDINVTGTTFYTNITGTSIGVDYIDFNNTLSPLPADQEGRIYWDEDNGSLSLGMHGGQVVQQIGLEQYYYVKNQSGATIDNGRVVRAAGTLGSSGRILGEYMIADGTIPAKFTLGIATEDIVNGDDGYVTEFGLVRGINTTGSLYGESWSGGTILYVSPTIPGGLTSVEPQAPNLKIEMAIVIDAKNNGSIFVRPNRYPHIYDLQEVNYTGGSENNLDILQWNGSNLTWDKTNTPSFSGLTVYNNINHFGNYILDGNISQTGNYNVTGNTTQIGDTTTNGTVDIIGSGTGCTLSVTGKTCLDGNLEITGDVNVIGNLTYDGNLIITGATIITSGLTVTSGLTTDTLNISNTPTENNDLIQILGRNSSTGDVEYRDVKTIGNNITIVTGSTYSATTTDDVIGIDSSTNTVTLYLPDSVSSGRLRYDIKDIGLNSLTNNITVLASGTDTIITSSSVSSIVLSNNGINITLINSGSGQWWQI